MKKRGRPSKTVQGARLPPSEKTPKEYRVQWYSCIIYPREDPKHETFLRWLLNYEPSTIYIEHTRDKWTAEDIDEWLKDKGKRQMWLGNKSAFFEVDDMTPCPHYVGEPKKPHVHVLFRHVNPITPSNLSKFFSPWVKHLEKVTDKESLVLYFLHITPESMDKARYEASELRYTDDWSKFVDTLNKTAILFRNPKEIAMEAIYEENCKTIHEALAVVRSCGLRTEISDYLVVNAVNHNIHRKDSIHE